MKTPVSESFNKVAGLRTVTLSKKRSRHRRFPVNFAKILRTLFLKNVSRQLLLFSLSHQHVFTISITCDGLWTIYKLYGMNIT